MLRRMGVRIVQKHDLHYLILRPLLGDGRDLRAEREARFMRKFQMKFHDETQLCMP